MTPEEIKFHLRTRHLTMSAISRRLNPKVTPQHVREVVHGRESRRVRAAIARALGKRVGDVFGGETAA